MNHSPWHSGLRLKSGERLSTILGQKTIKTECGQRVAYASADPDSPITCPNCLAEQAKFREACRQLGIE